MRLWQRQGESYEHILMKALGFAMFSPKYPTLEIEMKVGLRYKPDLIAQNAAGDFLFWGECGSNSLRKTTWLLKHTRAQKLALFKIGQNSEQLTKQLREEIPAIYRLQDRLVLINFGGDIVSSTVSKQIEKVPKEWFSETKI